MPTNSLLHSSRPIIELDGEENERLGDGLLRLLVSETIAGLYRCEAAFSNWGTSGGRPGFLYFDRQTLEFGKALRVKNNDETLFLGRIMALEATFPADRPPEVIVLAEDRLQDLRMTRRTRTFHDVSDAEVLQQIANDHGLSFEADISGPTHRVLAQVNQSDLAFARDRARAIGFEVWVDDTTFKAATRKERDAGPIELAYSRQLRDFTVLADLAHQRTSLTVSGWDVAAKSEIKHEAGDDALGGEIDEGESGASVLRSALGERKESVVHGVPFNADEAKAQAEAAFRLGARRFLRGRGLAEPAPGLRVGATVDLVGLGPLFSGQYYLSEVHHQFDGKAGLRTEFVAERAWVGRG